MSSPNIKFCLLPYDLACVDWFLYFLLFSYLPFLPFLNKYGWGERKELLPQIFVSENDILFSFLFDCFSYFFGSFYVWLFIVYFILLFIFNLNGNLTFFPIDYFMLFFEFSFIFILFLFRLPNPLGDLFIYLFLFGAPTPKIVGPFRGPTPKYSGEKNVGGSTSRGRSAASPLDVPNIWELELQYLGVV
jgi:hypothetical protein